MALDFDADETVVTLTEDKRGRPGFARGSPGRTMQFTVSSRFGTPRSRFVQSLLQRLGGDMVYVEAWKGDKLVATVSVPNIRHRDYVGNGSGEGVAREAALLVEGAAKAGKKLVAYGKDRVRWAMSFASGRGDSAEGADAAMPVGVPGSEPDARRLREEF